MIVYKSPSIVQLLGYDDKKEDLKDFLTYHDKRVDYELKRFKNSSWLLHKLGHEKYHEQLEALKASRYKSLLIENQLGELFTYSGLVPRIANHYGDTDIVNDLKYPEPELLAWAKPPEFSLRPYQSTSVEKLIDVRHGGVELATGLGKTALIQHLTKHFGLKTVVMAPSISIAGQILELLQKSFGKKFVGQYFDGKKEFKKQIVVAVAASLVRVNVGSEAWKHLKETAVFISDESHTLPATTLSEVCFGLMKDAHYRYFLSATQLRTDGLDLLLEAITGPIVHKMNVKDGVDQKYLAKPVFKMIQCVSNSGFQSRDSNEMTRKHLFYNPAVNQIAAGIANIAVSRLNHQVLILIEEVEQFSKLHPLLQHKAGFAHGGVDKNNKSKVPEAYHQSDPQALVKAFNDGELPILIGTSCISVGTDIKPVKTCIYLRGGTSEIEVRQGVGRTTRLANDKTHCMFFDFDVVNVDTCHRHAEIRASIYDDIYPHVEYINRTN